MAGGCRGPASGDAEWTGCSGLPWGPRLRTSWYADERRKGEGDVRAAEHPVFGGLRALWGVRFLIPARKDFLAQVKGGRWQKGRETTPAYCPQAGTANGGLEMLSRWVTGRTSPSRHTPPCSPPLGFTGIGAGRVAKTMPSPRHFLSVHKQGQG